VAAVFQGRAKSWKSLDYVAAWFMKAADYGTKTSAASAFVSTNSICQGQHVPILWPLLFATGHEIAFAYTSFKWANLASHNAGVTVIIVGISNRAPKVKLRFSVADEGGTTVKEADNINAYLLPSPNVEVYAHGSPLQGLAPMQFGNHPYYGAALIFTYEEARKMIRDTPAAAAFIRPFYGSQELIDSAPRACLWIEEGQLSDAMKISAIASKVAEVAKARRKATKDAAAQTLAETPYRFREQVTAQGHVLVIPRVSSENRPFLPVGMLGPNSIVQEKAFAMFDAPLWNMALIASRLHWVWIGTVCVRLEMRFSYSNTLGWNTFPVPTLTDKNKEDLTGCAEDILLVREHHFPATIADLYEPDNMPEDLRAAHERNDEVLERIYIGRRFKNDTERLEKLFDLYTKMTASAGTTKQKTKARA
jgi:hypothetical protein